MKLHVKWFTLSMVLTGLVPSLILFSWCAVNGFGTDLIRIFESVHPAGGFSVIPASGSTPASRIIAVVINSLYSAADFFIAGILFSSLYNFFTERFLPADNGK
jgi:hypothetical protein